MLWSNCFSSCPSLLTLGKGELSPLCTHIQVLKYLTLSQNSYPKKTFQVVVKCVCSELEEAEGPSFQLGGFTCPITEKPEGVTGISQHNLALADTTRLNCQPLVKEH